MRFSSDEILMRQSLQSILHSQLPASDATFIPFFPTLAQIAPVHY
jgi:hypothetical protein